MGFISVLSFAHKQMSDRLQAGDIAVDATAGTGADTLFLAQICGRKGKVFAFDIQNSALEQTKMRLDKETATIAQVELIHRSHAEMLSALPHDVYGNVGAVMFNLGYLPSVGANQSIITKTDSTIQALEAALTILKPRGIITVVLYPGHAGGDEEAASVEAWAASLPTTAGQAIIYRQIQRPTAPYLIAIEKKAIHR